MDSITENDLIKAVEAALVSPGADDSGAVTTSELAEIFNCDPRRVRKALRALLKDGLIERTMKRVPLELAPWGQRRLAFRFIGGKDALKKLVERLK